jgi:hypothetical protein
MICGGRLYRSPPTSLSRWQNPAFNIFTSGVATVVSIIGSVAGRFANGFDDWTSDHPASGNAGFAPPFQEESLWLGVPEPNVGHKPRFIQRG